MTSNPRRSSRLGRWWLAALLAGAISGVAWWLVALPDGDRGPASPPPAATPDLGPGAPNVVLVTIDTLRADRVSAYGSTRVSTPAIDELAAEGVRFANAASTVPFTLPAHSAMMTGTYPPTHGVRENVGYVLDERLPTLAERLRDGGWDTAGFVSAFVLDSRWGIARGFDTYHDDFDLEGQETTNLGAVQRDGAETVASALAWLDERGDDAGRPFFLWVHLFDPHDPYRPPEPFRSRYRHPYDGEVAYADSLVGELRRGLEERGVLDDSVVVLTADHGEGLGDHGEGFHGFFVYDSTVHVPLVIRLPQGREAGRVVEEVVSHVDLLPTVLALAGQEVPVGVQGRSLVPDLFGASGPAGAEESPERAVYSESLYPLLHYGWAPLRAIRTASHKLIDVPRPELYDLASDPREEHNVALQDRPLTRQLKRRLDAWRPELERGGPSEAASPELDPETLKQLQALGYMAGGGGAALDEEGVERADPKDRIALHQRIMAAQSELGAGELDAAARKLREALAEDDTIVDAHGMLGTIALRQERPEEALEHFQRALVAKPDHAVSLAGLADAYHRLGRLDEALVGYERLLALDPTDVRALLPATDILVARGDRSAAIRLLEPAAADDRPVVLNRLGELLAMEGRTAAAAAAFERAIAANEEGPQPRFNLAVIREEAGDLAAAMRLYEETLRLAPRHYQAQFNLARLAGASGDLDRQEELLEAAIASEPSFARGYYYLAKLVMDRRGDLGRAETLVRDGLAVDQDGRGGPLGYYVLADVMSRKGRRDEALRLAAEGRRLQERGAG